MLDPTKEIQAEQMACENGFSTHADSALRLNGSDYDSNIEQLARERDKVAEYMGEPESAEKTEQTEENTETEQSENFNGMSEMIQLLKDIKRNQMIYAPDR
jgi:capsid protein